MNVISLPLMPIREFVDFSVRFVTFIIQSINRSRDCQFSEITHQLHPGSGPTRHDAKKGEQSCQQYGQDCARHRQGKMYPGYAQCPWPHNVAQQIADQPTDEAKAPGLKPARGHEQRY